MDSMMPSECQCQCSVCVHQSDFFWKPRKHVSKFQYSVQCSGETNRTAREEEQTLSIESPESNNWGERTESCADSAELERADTVERKVETKKILLDFCIPIAESALWVAGASGMKIEKMMQIIFYFGFDARGLVNT